MINHVKINLLNIIDFFYPPFKKIISLQNFRYGVCGGSNAVLNLIVFYVSYNFIFTSDLILVGPFTISRYIAAYTLALSISFPIGFLLNKYVVFQLSNLRSQTQLLRYGMLTFTNIFLDYFLLHLLIGRFRFWATPSQAAIIILLSIFSYFFQTYFSFKTINK